jgi:hypothetical protein
VQIRAPATGRILKIIQDSEAVVQAGTPLIDIGDPVDLEVVADLLSTDAVRTMSARTTERYARRQVLAARIAKMIPGGLLLEFMSYDHIVELMTATQVITNLCLNEIEERAAS